jgi:hypothetical protein
MSDKISKAVDDAADTIKEGIHRTTAEGERAKRATVGEAMTPGEKIESVANEAVSDVKADIDHAKRNVRDST